MKCAYGSSVKLFVITMMTELVEANNSSDVDKNVFSTFPMLTSVAIFRNVNCL